MHPMILAQLSQAHTSELRRSAARARADRATAYVRPEARARRARGGRAIARTA